jgi:hypothetical protein
MSQRALLPCAPYKTSPCSDEVTQSSLFFCLIGLIETSKYMTTKPSKLPSQAASVPQSPETGHSRLPFLILVVAFALTLRVCVGSLGYSGFNTPPRFGDFEAQRHWLEVQNTLEYV